MSSDVVTTNTIGNEGSAINGPQTGHTGDSARKKVRNRKVINTEESPETAAVHKECLTIAKYIPCGLDAFCDLNEVFQVTLLLDQVALNQEDETLQSAAKKILSKIDERTHVRYRHTFDYVTVLAPHILTLIGDKTKGIELSSLMKEMQAEVMHIHAEDESRLRKLVGSYAVPHPNKQVIQPPISTGTKGGHAHMGFNHPQLRQMLCPVKYLKDYVENACTYVILSLVQVVVQKQFDDPTDTIKVTVNVWPAYLYPGDTAGCKYDPKMISKGLFRGYLVEHTIKHIFTSPSSALHKHVKGACSGNAKIHKMRTVKPKHIAYAAMQAHFMISSVEKWSDQDGLFNYPEYYYQIIHLICETRDHAWADSLIAHYNKIIFGSPHGLITTNSAITAENSNDDLLEMEHQFEEPFTPIPLDSMDDQVVQQVEVSKVNHNTQEDSNCPKESNTILGKSNWANQQNTAADGLSEPMTVTQQASFQPPSNTSTSSLSMLIRNASPGPGPSTSRKRKQLAQDLFDDGSPLMDVECEPELPAMKKKRGRASATRAKTGCTKQK